jgi:hypothetical protein
MNTPIIDPSTLCEKQREAIEVEITIKPKKI